MSTFYCEISINNGPAVQGALAIDTEMIDVTMSSKTQPDMDWEYVDQRGHFHAYDKDGKLPTLDARSEHVDCSGSCDIGEDCEGYDVTVYLCAICREQVEPRTITTHPVNREYVPGRMSWQVEVAQRLERDQRVSVKVTAGDRVWFGIGVATVVRADGDPIRYSTTIHGASPLGERKAQARTAA